MGRRVIGLRRRRHQRRVIDRPLLRVKTTATATARDAVRRSGAHEQVISIAKGGSAFSLVSQIY